MEIFLPVKLKFKVKIKNIRSKNEIEKHLIN